MANNVHISDFRSITALNKYIAECISQKKPLQVNIKDIMAVMMEWIKEDDSLSHFEDCLNCIDALRTLEKSVPKTYKTYENDLARILEAYSKKLILLLKVNTPETISSISQFFTVYDTHASLDLVKKSIQGTLNPFSALYGVQSAMTSLNKSHAQFANLNQRTHSERSQRAYSQLLTDILEGEKAVQELLPLIHLQEEIQENEQRSLLPETEYPAPSGEPEHPSIIGYNQTMNFNPEEAKAITDLFTTEDLKRIFLNAFPWSATLEDIDFLEEAETISGINLLGSRLLLEPNLQVAVIKYALLSLDTISKLAGYDGQLTIRNFALIKEISNNLQTVSDVVSKLNMNDIQKLAKNLETLTTNLRVQNKAYYRFRKDPNAIPKVQLNPNMNGFCHVNEILVHILTGVEFLKSVLTPQHPRANVAEKINQALAHQSSPAVFQLTAKPQSPLRADYLEAYPDENADPPKKKIKSKRKAKPKTGKAP